MPVAARAEKEAIAVLVRDGTASLGPGIAALRAAALRALVDVKVPLLVSDRTKLGEYAGRFAATQRVVAFAENATALADARAAFANLPDVTLVLLLVPTSPPWWGRRTERWASELAEFTAVDTIVLTDSGTSRTAVENYLNHVRADVRVLAPDWGSVALAPLDSTDTEHKDLLDMKAGTSESSMRWSFGASKTAGAAARLNFSGPSWDYGASASEPEPATPVEDDVADRDGLETNARVIERIAAPRRLRGTPLNIGVFGTKLTFIDELSRDLARNSGSNVTLDEWKYLSGPSDRIRAREVLRTSEVVIGEWARPNNVWIQKNATPEKRLIVRAHRYEVTVDFPHQIDMDRFEAGVVIVPWVGRALVQNFDWPAEKMVYIPNYVNSRYFRRSKLPGAEFTLGIVGVTPDLKRLDLALDLLEALRTEDLRYSLRVRGNLPPSHINWDKEPQQPEQWGSILHRIRVNPLLRNSVHFDAPGRDMAAWLEGIGVILSVSDLEGSHVALAEGIASGAFPVARNWPGIRTLWPSDFIFDSFADAVEWVLQSRDSRWREEQLARFRALASLDQDLVLDAWWSLVNGDRDSAQRHFGPIAWDADLYDPVRF